MKQRIRTVAIIRDENGILVLKRNRGRSEAPVFWELPTGKIEFGEQPEEAMTRALSEYVGLKVKTIKIKDAVTFLALEGSSRLSNLYIVFEITVSRHQKPDPRDRYTSYKYLKDVASSNIKLNEASLAVLEITEGGAVSDRISPRDTASAVAVFVDGASRGNPGPSGIGYQIVGVDGNVIEHGGEFIGFATSRIAEYNAMKFGIEKALDHGYKTVRFMSDSLMVVNQLNNIFTVKNRDVIPIYQSIQELLKNFENVSFTHIPRTENEAADTEANLAIDRILKHK